MIDRLSIHFDKNLNRMEYFKNQLLCLCLVFAAVAGISLSLPSLVQATVLGYIKPSIHFLTYFACLGASLVTVVYTTILSVSNVDGRFTNLCVNNKAWAWVIYFVVGLFPAISWLHIVLYFLPAGFFASHKLKD